MRIGIDVRLQNESGVGRYIRNLTKELRRIDKDNKYIFVNPQIRWHSIKEQIIMPFVLYKKRLDLAHFPYFNVPIFYPKKFIATIHDLTINQFATGKASTLNPILYKLKLLGYKLILLNAVKRAEKIIAPTKYVKEQIVDQYGVNPDKIIVIYEGVNKKLKVKSEKSKAQVKSKKLNIKEKSYFLYVGNAYPHKNLEMLLKAFSLLKTHHTPHVAHNAKLVLVGKEDYFYKKLKNKVKKLNLSKNVIFTGYVSDEQLVLLYQNAISLVFPSLNEGFGLPALEAMANECLVVCSDIPALREVCSSAAVYFNPEDMGKLSKEMNKLVVKPSIYQEKIKLGKKRSAQFSWQKTAEETLKVYENSFSL